MNAFNPADFRRHFPAIQSTHVYLDNAATALKPQAVIDAMHHFYASETATVHRSQHRIAAEITERFEQARSKIAALINAPSAEQIIWVRGTTEAINLVAQSYARPRLKAGDQIVVSEAEHHANLIPWIMVAQQTGAQVIKLPLGRDYLPDLTLLPSLLNEKTRILALGQMSNVTGGTPELDTAVQLAHQVGAVVVIDGAQGIVHCPTDVQKLDIDFYAFSGHKLYGPTGIGVLYGKPELLDCMPPWQGGGKMLTQTSFTEFLVQKPPYRFEAGTPNIAGVLGFAAAVDWLKTQDRIAAEDYSVSLADRADHYLRQLPAFRSFRCAHSSLLAFNIEGCYPNDLATLLAEQEISVRAGQHCAQPLMTALGVGSTLRASFAPYNTQHEVDHFLNKLEKAIHLLTE